MVSHRSRVQYIDMIEEPLSAILYVITALAAGMYPLGFLFGSCSPCCQGTECPWTIEFDRCLRVSFVGSSPPSGGDCHIVSRLSSVGDVEYISGALTDPPNDFVQLYNAQSRVRVPIRLSLSASGDSRTPVGATRSQVWRFNRNNITSPQASTYDVIGPPWHLEVNVTVTGVATQQESGVTSSIDEDEHQQPRLTLAVNQWTASITHEVEVTLFPTGLQRWGPVGSGTQSFRLTSGIESATLVQGDAYAGWSVQKTQGLTIEERSLAMRLSGTICGRGGGGSVTQRILLNEESVVAFVNGDADITVSVPGGQRDLRILPKNALCQTPADFVGVGSALGIYPEIVYADAPQSLLVANPSLCKNPLTLELKTIVANSWQYSGEYSSSLSALLHPVAVGPSEFWAGLTLLWNAETGPYRNSLVASGPGLGFSLVDGWTYRISGGNEHPIDEFLLSSHLFSNRCAEFEVAVAYACVPSFFSVSVEYDVEIVNGACGQGGNPFTVSVARQMGFSPYSGSVPAAWGTFPAGPGQFYISELEASPPIYFSQPSPFQLPCMIRHFGIAKIPVQCDLPKTQEFFVNVIPVSIWGEICNLQQACAGASVIRSFPASASVKYSRRNVCGDWAPDAFSANGGVTTRTCNVTDSVTVTSSSTENASVTSTNSRLPKIVDYLQVLQQGRCNLFGLRLLSQLPAFDGSYQTAANPLALSPQAGQCVSFFLMFGAIGQSPSAHDRSTKTSVPCNNCTPVVAVVSGAEYASVYYRTSGERSGIIDVISKTAWLPGQGVIFTVSCGSDTITQQIRRNI